MICEIKKCHIGFYKSTSAKKRTVGHPNVNGMFTVIHMSYAEGDGLLLFSPSLIS